jgi:hypothetical protein
VATSRRTTRLPNVSASAGLEEDVVGLVERRLAARARRARAHHHRGHAVAVDAPHAVVAVFGAVEVAGHRIDGHAEGRGQPRGHQHHLGGAGVG